MDLASTNQSKLTFNPRTVNTAAPPTPVPLAGSPPISAPRVSRPANPALQVPTGRPAGATASPSTTPQTPATNPIPLATSQGATPYAASSPTVPGTGTDYTTQTITPGAGVDRLALAKSNFENFKTSTEPEYEATLRKAGQSGAAAGQVGSGMLRGTLGDIGLSRTRDLQSAENSFLNNATEGGIEDSYRNIGIAQQQQGFQSGEQSKAFDQAQRQQALDEALRNGDFERYYQLLQAGNAGNPSDIQLALAGNYGAQSSAAGQSAGGLASSAVRNPYQVPLAA